MSWDVQSSDPAKPLFLEPHDLAVAKLARLEQKDKDFVSALIEADLLVVNILRQRAYLISDGVDSRIHAAIHGWLDYYDGGNGRRRPAVENPAAPSGEAPRGDDSEPTSGSSGPRSRYESSGVHPTDT